MNEAEHMLQYQQRAFDTIFNQLLTPRSKPDPEPLLEHYADRATWQDAHDTWTERQGDELAKDTNEGCCGDCK